MRRKRKCVGCKKTKAIRSRILCDACYEAARRLVNSKKNTWTWEKLEREKLAGPLVVSPFRLASPTAGKECVDGDAA